MQLERGPASEREWLAVRRYLGEHRAGLAAQAAARYPGHLRCYGAPLLTRPGWLPARPLPLAGIQLSLDEAGPEPRWPAGPGAAALPLAAGGTPYASYASAFQALDAPLGLANRRTYRLDGAVLDAGPGRLAFSCGRYFDHLDYGEASAHAFAARQLGAPPGSLREDIGDPCDLARRPANLAVSALTIRKGPGSGQADFFLHWRDPRKVAHAGGLLHVIPAGVFQPSGDGEWNLAADLSLTRFLARELAEELAGQPERYDNASRPLDYDGWPFARGLSQCLLEGTARAWCLGIGVDPLTFATDLLAVLVFDAAAFAALFGQAVAVNDEGRVIEAVPFTQAAPGARLHRQPLQAAGAALLAGAWRHRDLLLA